jgi:RNA polymerase sigma-70 factor (ECF subfamily)
MHVGDRPAAAIGGASVEGHSPSAEIIKLAQAGVESAFAELIKDRHGRLYRTAWAILRNEADAFDAVQETCVSAWQQLPRLRDLSAFDAWLTRSLVNRCRTMLRSRRRTAVREVSLGDDGQVVAPATEGGLGGFADAQAIRLAFARLKPDERTYLALHYAEGRSITEIATLLGAPEGTIKWRLSRARDALQRQLARGER